MSKWLEDLLLNIEIWLYRRLRKLLQHGDATFAGIDTLHADLAQKEQYRDGVYLHLRERLEGTDEHPLAEGVPVRPLPATQDLAHLQEAVELLGERKIEDASPDIPDGVSLVRLLCDSSLASQVTELVDTNHDWVMDKELNTFTAANITAALLCCRTMDMPNYSTIFLRNYTNLQALELPNLIDFFFASGNYGNELGMVSGSTKLERVYMPLLQRVCRRDGTRGAQVDVFQNCKALKEVIAPNLTLVGCEYFIVGCTSLQKVVLGTLTADFGNAYSSYANNFQQSTDNLVHFEIGNGVAVSLHLNWWLASMALRTDTTASDYIDLREDKDDSGEFIYQNNLQQFLSNFKAYIADRLADRTGKKTLTLTLSQAVRDVLTAEIEDIIVSQKHWVISPAKSV